MYGVKAVSFRKRVFSQRQSDHYSVYPLDKKAICVTHCTSFEANPPRQEAYGQQQSLPPGNIAIFREGDRFFEIGYLSIIFRVRTIG
jgi:hypothetical protein